MGWDWFSAIRQQDSTQYHSGFSMVCLLRAECALMIEQLLPGASLQGQRTSRSARSRLRRDPGERQPDLKPRVAGFGIQLNTSAVLLHDALDRVQTEARALANAFGSKKRLEDVGLHFFGNSRPIVADFDHGATVVAVSSDAKLAGSVHGVDRVVDNVRPDLVELAAKRIHEERNEIVLALHRYSSLQLVIQDRKRSLQAPYHIDVLDRRLIHVGVFLDGADQLRYTRGAAFDFMQQAGDFHGGGDSDQGRSGSLRIKVREQ